MALCIPIHLRQRTSRVYQDHPTISDQVLTSLVPPVHNQGVSSAPLQGHALWNIFLPTTGSFFVCFITDFLPSCNSTFQWTFSCYIPFFSAVVADLNAQIFSLSAQISHESPYFPVTLCSHCNFRSYDVLQHLLTIISNAFRQNQVENSDQLARNCYD